MKEIERHFDAFSSIQPSVAYSSENSMNFQRLKIVMDLLAHVQKGDLLDLGCGGGVPLAKLAKIGWKVTGVDISRGMLKQARKTLDEHGIHGGALIKSDVTNLKAVPSLSFDVVICLGVSYYLRDKTRLYAEVSRVLKPDGVFICSYQNELFDLMTFNRYTMNFWNRNVIENTNLSPIMKETILRKLGGLISFPEEPVKHSVHSARDVINTESENPFLIKVNLRRFGFRLNGKLRFFSPYPLPPLLGDDAELGLADARLEMASGLPSWIHQFICGHFIVKATKI